MFKDEGQLLHCFFLPLLLPSITTFMHPYPSWPLQSLLSSRRGLLPVQSPKVIRTHPPSPGFVKLYAFHASKNSNRDLVTPSQKGPVGFGIADNDFIGKAIDHNYEIMKWLSICPCLITPS